jgi:hypothetical protein
MPAIRQLAPGATGRTFGRRIERRRTSPDYA